MLAVQKEKRLLEGHLIGGHVHMLISVLPKNAISQAVEYMKGKSAIHVTKTYGGREYLLLNDRYPLVSSAVKKPTQFAGPFAFNPFGESERE